jgi:hypothetical protein
MAATKRNINWSSCVFASSAITGVTNATVGQGGNLLKFKADVDIFPTLVVMVDQEPHVSITSADVGLMMGFTPGQVGTLTLTHNDAKSASLGAVVFVMINAVFENADDSGAHAQVGSATGTWQGYSSDGATNPLSFTRV